MSTGFIFWICVFAAFAVLAFVYAAYIIFHRDKREFGDSDLKFTEEELGSQANSDLSQDNMANPSLQNQSNPSYQQDFMQNDVHHAVNNENNDQQEAQQLIPDHAKTVSRKHVFRSKTKKRD